MAARSRRYGLLVVLAWLAVPGPMAQSESTGYADEYGSGNYGRIRFADHGVTITRAEWDTSDGPAGLEGANAPIFPGDTVTTDAEQRAEVQLAGGALIWIDRETEVTFLSLPDPYAEFPDNTVLHLARGTVRIGAALDREEEFRIDTPTSTVYPLGDGDLRIEIPRGGLTRVTSRRGVAEVVGADGSVILRGGMGTEIAAGSLPAEPYPVSSFSADGFDSWIAQRAERYLQHEGLDRELYDDLPPEVQPYGQELEAHGDWVETEDYGYVWSPSEVGDDWRPYANGYWHYGSGGYFWVSNEPWGWAPYHYGRWTWIAPYGWCWSPGRVFGGAWVAWSWGSAYLGWGPLDYWNYPAYRGGLYYGYYDPWCWTFVSYSHVYHHGYRYGHHYGYRTVPYHDVHPGLHDSAVVTRPPRVSPRELATSAQARGDAVRRARADRTARIAPGRPERAGGASFRATEGRRSRATAEGRRTSSTRDAGRSRQERSDAARRGGDGRRTGTRTGQQPASRDRLPVVTEPGFERRLSSGTARSRHGAPAGMPPTAGNGRNSRAEPLGTSERLRDIYRKAAQPRRTRQRPAEAGASSSTSSQTQPTRTRSTPQQRARPNPGSSSRGRSSQPRATPRATPSPKKTPPSRGGSSGARAPRSSPSRSGAKAGGSPKQGSRPRATGSRGRSTPKASPRSSGSSRGTSRSRPSRRSSGRRGGSED